MKNLIRLLSLFIVISLAEETFAQTKRGNVFVSGGTGLQFTSSSVKYVYDGETQAKSTVSSISFAPSIAYFVIDNLAVGLTGNINSGTNKLENGDKYITNTTLIMPTALYYFPIEGKIRPIVQLAAGLSSHTEKSVPKTGADTNSSAAGLAFNIGAGVSYFVKENISINFGLSYTLVSLTSGDNKSKMEQGNFGANIGLAIYF